MDYVYAVINEMDRKLDRTIRDLDDVRMIMDTLGKIREQEVDMELRIDPIEVFERQRRKIILPSSNISFSGSIQHPNPIRHSSGTRTIRSG